MLLPGVCWCPAGFSGDLCESPITVETAQSADDTEAGSAAWAALILFPLAAAAGYFVYRRGSSGKAELGGIDFESAYDPTQRRNSFEAVATAMLAQDPEAFESVIEKLSAEGLQTQAAPGGRSSAATSGEVPIMMEGDTAFTSRKPSADAGLSPITMLQVPAELRVLQTEGEMKRSRSYEGALNTMSADDTDAVSIMMSSPPVPVHLAMSVASPEIVVENESKTFRFKSVKRSNPLFAMQQQNRGITLLEEDAALMEELNSDAETAYKVHNGGGEDETGVAIATESLAGAALFAARRQHQSSPLAQENLAAGTSTGIQHASEEHQLSPLAASASVKHASHDVLSARKGVTRQSTNWGLLEPSTTAVSRAEKAVLERKETDWSLLDRTAVQPTDGDVAFASRAANQSAPFENDSITSDSAQLLASAKLATQLPTHLSLDGDLATSESTADHAGIGHNSVGIMLSGTSMGASSVDQAERGVTPQTMALDGVPAGTSDVDAAQRGINDFGRNAPAELALSSSVPVSAARREVNAAAAVGDDGATVEDVEAFMTWFAARETQFVADDLAATEAAAKELEEAGLEAVVVSERPSAEFAGKGSAVLVGGNGAAAYDAGTTALFRAKAATNGDQFENMAVSEIADSDLFRAWLAKRYDGIEGAGLDEIDAVYSAHQARQSVDAAEDALGGTIDDDELDAVYRAHQEGQSFDAAMMEADAAGTNFANSAQNKLQRPSASSTASGDVLNPDLFTAKGVSNLALPAAFFGMREAGTTDFAEKEVNDAVLSTDSDGIVNAMDAEALFYASKGTQPIPRSALDEAAAAAAAAVANGEGTHHVRLKPTGSDSK